MNTEEERIKINKIYRLSIASIVLVSVSVLSVSILSAYYIVTYGPPLVEVVDSVPVQIEHIIENLENTATTLKDLVNETKVKLDITNSKIDFRESWRVS